ncbi:MAG: HD domain-containing protein, partial [Atopobiaceae bacterium]|nr:HD domain-containing protein [Atopobiaceae bacterium]
MDDSRLIEEALAFARDVFEGDSSGHDYAHTLRIVHMATRLAQAEGADVTIVQLAAALHDVDDRKLSPETHENLKRARDFMAGAGVDDETTAQVCQIIREVSFRGSDSVTPTTEPPPISWTTRNGRFSMALDMRVKYDVALRRKAADL